MKCLKFKDKFKGLNNVDPDKLFEEFVIEHQFIINSSCKLEYQLTLTTFRSH